MQGVPARFYLSVAIFSTAFGIMSPAVPLYAKLSFGTNEWELGVLGAMMAIPYVAGSVYFGKFSDRIGRKPLIMAGLGLYTAVIIAYAFAPSILVFGILRCLEGVAFSMIWPSAEAFVADMNEGASMDRPVGVYSLAWSSGYTVGPFLMGAVLSVGSLASSFLVALILVVAALSLLANFSMRSSRKRGTAGEGVRVRTSGIVYVMVVWGFAMLSFYFLFPPYALAFGISPSAIGYMVGCASGMRTISFLIYGKRLKKSPATVGMGLLALSMLIGWIFPNYLGFLMMSIVFGSSLGVLYAFSLGRMLELPSKGSSAGIFEAAIGFGQFLGPITMGYAGFLLGSSSLFLALFALALASVPIAFMLDSYRRAT